MGFDITILGSSGGPIEGSTCSLLIKPLAVSYADIIEGGLRHQLLCFDAGSGLRLLAEILYKERHGVQGTTDYLYNHSLDASSGILAPTSSPFAALNAHYSPFFLAQQIIDHIEAYLLSHPHLDHTAALVLNSAGTTNCQKKIVYGSAWTLDALQKHIFNNVIWPDMPSFHKMDLVPLLFDVEFHTTDNVFSITMFELSHGSYEADNVHCRYQLLASLITHVATLCSVVVFGDFESDSSSGKDFNKTVWKRIAQLISQKDMALSAIVLECSNSCATPDTELYGHILSTHLVRELQVLQAECIKLDPETPQPLLGLNLIITHVKEAYYDPCSTNTDPGDPRIEILAELRRLCEELDLGLQISAAVTGTTFSI